MDSMKPPSSTIMTEIVLPTDANSLGYLRGGRLVDWMDVAAEIACQRHCGRAAVTVSMDKVSFSKPIKVGEIVTVQATLVKTRKTSMEIKVEVWTENIRDRSKQKTNEATLTFVAVDAHGSPVKVPGLFK